MINKLGLAWNRTFKGANAGETERIESIYNYELYKKLIKKIFYFYKLEYKEI